MKIPVPAALAAVAVVASCAAAVIVFYGGAWFEEMEPAIEMQPAVSGLEPSLPAAPEQIIEVKTLEIDLQTQRVQLPGEDWISAPEFWEIYYNEPHRLPGDIDFAKLQQLEELAGTAPEPGNASQQADTNEPDLALDPSIPDPSADPTPEPALDPALDPDRVPVWDPAGDA